MYFGYFSYKSFGPYFLHPFDQLFHRESSLFGSCPLIQTFVVDHHHLTCNGTFMVIGALGMFIYCQMIKKIINKQFDQKNFRKNYGITQYQKNQNCLKLLLNKISLEFIIHQSELSFFSKLGTRFHFLKHNLILNSSNMGELTTPLL